jgi:hypothetical protein
MKIALICAHPAGTNSGMISVDASFNTVQTQLGSNVEVTRFCSWRSLTKGETLTYEHYYSQDQLKDYDLIIFWGDFLQWIEYCNNDWLIKSKSMNMPLSESEMIDLWYSLFLLEGNIELQKKTILFGGTLYGLDSKQLSNNRYCTALTSLATNSKLMLMRDVMSGNFISQLAPSKVKTFGCDCSLLFEPYYFNNNFETPQFSYFVYSFARSGENEKLKQLAKKISVYLGIEAIEIPWISKGAGLSLLEKNIKLIQHSQFTLTDIYHLSLNSWREKIPAVCIGQGNSIVENSVSDKKKEIFYHQIFGLNYYMFLEDILLTIDTDEEESLLQKIKFLFNDSDSIKFVTDHIEFQKLRSLNLLLEAINA